MSDLSRNEALVLGALKKGGGARTAYALLEELRLEGLRAPPQIYRALKSLGERGLVHRLDSRNAFVACAHAHDHGGAPHAVIFLVCERCDLVRELCDEAIDRRIEALAERQGFASPSAAVEIHGLCRECRPSD